MGLPRARSGQRPGILPTLLTVGTLLVASQGAHAQTPVFPINETFTGTKDNTPNFITGGDALLTGTNTEPGYLRLSSAEGNQAGYAIFKNSFPSVKGFSISFEFFSYDGTSPGADGLSVFLVDAQGTDPTTIPSQFRIGAYGGSLGYAQINNAKATLPGISKGYLGIGLDEYGNYSQANEGRQGGPGFRPQTVALRGAGDGMTGYAYLTGSSTPFTLNVGTRRAQRGSPDYRKAYLYVLPIKGPNDTTTGYSITIRLQHGSTVTTTTNEYAVATPPSDLRMGFAGSTGDNTSIHEVRNLAILDNPYAVDDVAQTSYQNPVTLGAVANDRGIGADINPATVDLNPDTPERDDTYTVPGKGTFSVNSSGVVTFTPSGTFAGVVSLPYVVRDVVDKVSNPAIMTVNVAGADVASSISGPASVNPGNSITYLVTTRNNGDETAYDVSPTLQLPMGTSVPASSDNSYSYDDNTGLLTFTSIPSLTATSSVTNSVTIIAPEPSGSTITVTSSFIYATANPAPDPLADNNSATLSTNVVAPLPVELAQFEVTPAYRDALVTWRTATEQHNDYFTVERSLTGTKFQAIGTVRSQGNGLTPHAYSFTDAGAGQLNAETVYYRLRQTDTNGTLTYSPVRSVHFAAVAKATATLYPNPSQGQTLLDLSSLPAGPYLVQVLDLTGRVLRTQNATTQTATLDLAGLPQGAYLVLVQGAGVRQALPLLRN
ncbi:MAG: lectin-like domain-containing protein [Janthinobacterium lividum]